MHFPFHPAPGLGDLLPGFFVVPQNPILDAGTPLVPSVQATAPNQVLKVHHIGELMPGMWTVPQNPLIQALATVGTSGASGLGCMGCGMAGLGQTSTTDILTGDSLGLGMPNWVYLAAGVLAWVIFMPGGSEYRKKKSALASQYRGYTRAKRAVAGARSYRSGIIS
jgi:hypothetical protein